MKTKTKEDKPDYNKEIIFCRTKIKKKWYYFWGVPLDIHKKAIDLTIQECSKRAEEAIEQSKEKMIEKLGIKGKGCFSPETQEKLIITIFEKLKESLK